MAAIGSDKNQPPNPPIVSMRGIVKSFGGTRAVADVDFDVRPGEVHALLGGNGAGKSTLIKVLAGVHPMDAGEVRIDGNAVDPMSDRLPVAYVHQDLGLVEWMSVAENIALATGFPRHRGLIDWNAANARAQAALALIDCPIAPDTRIADLSRTDKSIVAIARALATQADAVVLDEPTASLPEAEVGRLFTVLDRLRRQGRGMVYVSHRLDEIFRIADRVTVMRDGARVATLNIRDTTPRELVSLIVGRVPAHPPTRVVIRDGAPVLRLKGFATAEAGPVDIEIRPGEIVGFAGLRGAGQDSIGRAICGIEAQVAGEKIVGNIAAIHPTPADAVEDGIAFVSSKRTEESVALPLAIRENLFVNPLVEGRRWYAPLSEAKEAVQALSRLRDVGAKPLVTEPAIHTFSGGNQQKVVIARWLGQSRRVLVLEEPTMGVDVGAKSDIYALLDRQAAQGGAVIVVSSDLEEIAALCQRCLIFDRGRVATELHGPELSVSNLLEHVGGAGVPADEGAALHV